MSEERNWYVVHTQTGHEDKVREKINLQIEVQGFADRVFKVLVPTEEVVEVKIPAGIEDGARLRLAGQGEAGANGGPSGDFYLDIHVRPDKRFERVGNDLVMRVDVPFTTLALGGEIEIETIDDKKLVLICR